MEHIISLVPYHRIEIKPNTMEGRIPFETFKLLIIGNEKDSLDMKLSIEAINPLADLVILNITNDADAKKKLESLGDTKFHVVVANVADETVKTVTDWLEERDSSLLQNGGHLFIGKTVDFSAIKPMQLPKSKHLSVIPTLAEKDNAKWAAAFAAVIAMHAESEPARPFQTLRVLDSVTPDPSFKQKTSLLNNRFCAWGVEDGHVKIERIVTTDFSESNISYRDLNHKLTISFIRNDLKTFLKGMFPRHMLSEDPRSSGEVVTPSVLKAFIVDRHKLWIKNNFCQDPNDDFGKNLKVTIDQVPGKVNIAMGVHLMGQLIQTNSVISFKI